MIRCCQNLNGNGTESTSSGSRRSLDGSSERMEKILEEKRRAELSARIASGEFTVQKSGYVCYD